MGQRFVIKRLGYPNSTNPILNPVKDPTNWVQYMRLRVGKKEPIANGKNLIKKALIVRKRNQKTDWSRKEAFDGRITKVVND